MCVPVTNNHNNETVCRTFLGHILFQERYKVSLIYLDGTNMVHHTGHTIETKKWAACVSCSLFTSASHSTLLVRNLIAFSIDSTCVARGLASVLQLHCTGLAAIINVIYHEEWTTAYVAGLA